MLVDAGCIHPLKDTCGGTKNPFHFELVVFPIISILISSSLVVVHLSFSGQVSKVDNIKLAQRLCEPGERVICEDRGKPWELLQ